MVDLDQIRIPPNTQEIFGRLLETDHGDTDDRRDQDEGTAGKHDISPSRIVGPAAVVVSGAVESLIG
jgi:hypothetical protein